MRQKYHFREHKSTKLPRNRFIKKYLYFNTKITANNLAILFNTVKTRRSFEAIMDYQDVDLASLKEFNLVKPYSAESSTANFDCRVESLNADTFDDLPNLLTVKIPLATTTSPSFDLTSLETLRHLNTLIINKASYDERTKLVLKFDSFENLTFITLNGLDIDLNAFRCLKSLRGLHFYGCKLDHLTSENFSEMTGLLSLNLSYCGIEALGADLFDHLVNLRLLFLMENRVSTLHADTFKNLTLLTNLYMSQNSLTKLETNLFKGLHSLDSLDLSYNHLTELDVNVFATNKQLQTLSLRNIDQLFEF